MNLVDLIVILLCGLAAYRGWRRGLLGQVFEFGLGFVGLLVGVALGPRVASLFTQRPGPAGPLISLLVVFIMLSIGQAIGFILGHRFGTMARAANLGSLDSILGSGFGIVVMLVSFWLIGSLLINGPSRPLAKELNESKILDVVNDALPKPPDVLAYLRQYLSTSGFPQVFVGMPPSIGPPVDLPSNAQARKAIEAADQSTVRIQVPACGGTQLGSGWVAASSTVVTNAHVVAGGDDVTVEDETGSHAGSVVLFDPKTDIAIIHADGLAGPPLELDTELLDIGTPGATLGYPGGGRLDPEKAAVQNQFDARGKDIYGRSDVTREVYELRARVRQGDSGGPFVVPSGRVAGVVFAASTTDSGTGYALTGGEVSDEVRQGSQRTSAVSTGGCTR